jgi:hypothetical protein
MRSASVLGIVLVAIGVLLLYLLRSLLIHVIVVLLGIGGLVVGLIFIVVGLGLIFGRRAIKRGLTWQF